MDPSKLTPRSIETAFETAKRIAAQSFMAGMPFQIERQSNHEIAVEFDSLTEINVLHTTASSPFVAEMAKVVGNYQDAWLLTLAHEHGHMVLNQDCHAAGFNPNDTNRQLEAMGIILTSHQQQWIPDFHKESAIEAYCDARLLQFAFQAYPQHWKSIAGKLLEIRRSNSERFERNPTLGRYGDEYFCATPIETVLNQNAALPANQAARIALISSMEHTPLHLDIINASLIAMDDLLDRLKPASPPIHQKMLHSSKAALGRLQAEGDSIKVKLKEWRLAKKSRKPPSLSPPKSRS